MGEMVVNSRAVARLKLSQFDKFEARNRPHLRIPIRYRKKILKVSHSANLKRHKRDDFFMFLKMHSCAFV